MFPRAKNASCFLSFGLALILPSWLPPSHAAEPATAPAIRHSYLVLSTRTVIVDEQGEITWEYRGGSRDGFVLPNRNVLIAWSDRVEEVTPQKTVIFSYTRDPRNKEIGTAQRLYNGNTLITELGPVPRLLEVDPKGAVARETPLQPETDNAHMQTRMARQLRNGNFLVPHLLAFAVKEYSPDGTIVNVLRTDLAYSGGGRTVIPIDIGQ